MLMWMSWLSGIAAFFMLHFASSENQMKGACMVMLASVMFLYSAVERSNRKGCRCDG